MKFTTDGGIDGALDGGSVFEEVVEQSGGDASVGKLLVQCLGRFVEDVSEEAVVDEFVVSLIGLLEVTDVTVEEA